VAVVTFGSVVTVVEPLSTDRARQRESVRNLVTQLRTQLGTGLVEGVRVVTGEAVVSGSPPSGPGAPGSGSPGADPEKPRAVAILLSDGRASDGVPPLDAAEEARRKGVRVHTVGVATTKDPSKLRSGYFGVLDDETLIAIAQATGGRYYPAASAGRLGEVYRELARAIAWETTPTEVTAVAAMLAAALVVAAVVLRSGVYLLH
jgi:Ca-activated chloride channel family protein